MNNPQLLDHIKLVVKSLLLKGNYTVKRPKSQIISDSWGFCVYVCEGMKADTFLLT